MATNQEYWLLTDDHKKLASEALRRINRYAERMDMTGRAAVWTRMSRLAFSRDIDSGLDARSTQTGGNQGELLGTRGNLLGRYVRAVHTLITGTRPGYTARSVADSSESIAQCNAATSLLDFVVSKRGGEEAARRAQVFCLLYGEGWLSATWDERKGRLVGRELLDEDGNVLQTVGPDIEIPEGVTTRERYEGDIRVVAKRPDEIVRDVDLDETSDHEWIGVAEQVSRWKLAAQYPQFADIIATTDACTQLETIRSRLRLEQSVERKALRDVVTVYKFYCPPNPLIPEGRYFMLLGEHILADDKALYEDFSVYPMIPDYEPTTKWGHSFLWDLIGPQQCSDAALVSLVSTVENYGKPVLFVPEGSNLDVSKDAAALPFRLVKGTTPPSVQGLSAGVLEPLLAARNEYADSMTLVSGLNDVALGDAGKSQSGDALETMHTLAQQSVSPAAAEYASAFGRMLFGCILRYRTFATTERMIQVVGKQYAADVETFKASSIATIDGVDTEMVPASLRHAAGRKAFADKMWEAGVLGQDPQRYLECQATGKIEPILHGPQAARRIIEDENERLRAGKPVTVALTDDDRLHIAEHAIPLSDPLVRENPNHPVFINTTAHIQAHIQALAGKTVDICEALGQVPLSSVAASAQAQQQAAAQMAMQPPAAPMPAEGAPMQEPGGDIAPGAAAMDPNAQSTLDVPVTA